MPSPDEGVAPVSTNFGIDSIRGRGDLNGLTRNSKVGSFGVSPPSFVSGTYCCFGRVCRPFVRLAWSHRTTSTYRNSTM